VRAFLLDVLAKAAIARAVAALPFLGWPIIGPIFAWGVNWIAKYMYEGVRDEINLADIARVNFERQDVFDAQFLKVKLVNAQVGSTFEQKAKVVNEAHDALDKFALYQRRRRDAA
jgi:hypothetical protein